MALLGDPGTGVTRGSYDLKLDRAETHLVELNGLIDGYVSKHPYEVASRVEGKKKRIVHRLHFTEQPDPELGVVTGDFVYNVRSALDHMMAALVPSARRSAVYFPIYWQGVWDDPKPGEHSQRVKDRARWNSDTLKVDPAALAILKANQPLDDGRQPPETHGLLILNRIATKDRHTRLPIVGHSVTVERGRGQLADGTWVDLRTRNFDPMSGYTDDAQIDGPNGVVKMEIEGTPRVHIKVRQNDPGGYLIPECFDDLYRCLHRNPSGTSRSCARPLNPVEEAERCVEEAAHPPTAPHQPVLGLRSGHVHDPPDLRDPSDHCRHGRRVSQTSSRDDDMTKPQQSQGFLG